VALGDGSFTTWIGDPPKIALGICWQSKGCFGKSSRSNRRKYSEAWEALYAAEGSDWFWWFGEGHSSNQDAIFDRLFREHLCGNLQGVE